MKIECFIRSDEPNAMNYETVIDSYAQFEYFKGTRSGEYHPAADLSTYSILKKRRREGNPLPVIFDRSACVTQAKESISMQSSLTRLHQPLKESSALRSQMARV
jgi:hypothetical protein